MGTEKFIAFKEDGSAYRLKGRILRFLDNEPVSEADKTNIRSTLSVPASAEGLTPANNLSDLDNAATARTNLSVNSIDEDAEAAGTKLVGPALYFDGTNDYLEVSDDSRLSFTDGVDDLPFAISVWFKPIGDGSTQTLVAKYGSFNSTREYYVSFGGTNKNTQIRIYSVAASGYISAYTPINSLTVGDWYNIVYVYKGSGPNSDVSYASAFSDATQVFDIYINGVQQTVTQSNFVGFSGMSNTGQVLQIGRQQDGLYAEGHIKDVKIYNRELTATEVAKLARGTDLGFSDEFGGALGGVYTSDFSAGADGWNIVGTLTLTGNIDSVGPGGDLRDDTLRFVPDATNGAHAAYKSGLTNNKRYRISFDYYVPSTNSNVDSFNIALGSGNFLGAHTATLDAWTSYSVEGVCSKASNLFLLYLADGGSTIFADAGSDDTLYIRNVKFTAIGNLADFRAEDFNESGGKLLDRSINNFVAVNNGATLTGKRRHISAATLDLTDLPTSSAGLSAGEVWSNSGVLTIV